MARAVENSEILNQRRVANNFNAWAASCIVGFVALDHNVPDRRLLPHRDQRVGIGSGCLAQIDHAIPSSRAAEGSSRTSNRKIAYKCGEWCQGDGIDDKSSTLHKMQGMGL